MAVSSKSVKIGIIAEEQNDIDTIYEITCKIIDAKRFSFSQFIGHGSGTLQRKCSAWAKNLLDKGCSHLVVIHDLDKRAKNELRKMLEDKIRGLRFGSSIILIPVEELEAWFLADPAALKSTFNMKKLPKTPKSPENIKNPKELLAKLVYRNSSTRYLNTVHNRRIARALSVATLKRCSSFSPYPHFLTKIFRSHP